MNIIPNDMATSTDIATVREYGDFPFLTRQRANKLCFWIKRLNVSEIGECRISNPRTIDVSDKVWAVEEKVMGEADKRERYCTVLMEYCMDERNSIPPRMVEVCWNEAEAVLQADLFDEFESRYNAMEELYEQYKSDYCYKIKNLGKKLTQKAADYYLSVYNDLIGSTLKSETVPDKKVKILELFTESYGPLHRLFAKVEQNNKLTNVSLHKLLSDYRYEELTGETDWDAFVGEEFVRNSVLHNSIT